MHKPTRTRSTILIVLGCTALGPMVMPACSDNERATSEHAEKSANSGDGLNSVDDADSLLAAGIVGSKHDFTSNASHPIDLCTPCHTPHLPPVKLASGELRTPERVRTYQSHGVQLDAASLLCLSCHDGVIATDVFTAAHATRFVSQLGASSNGGVLSGHPIGVKYPFGEPTYHPMNAVIADGRIKLPEGRVQCISCHDPHNTERHGAMLVRSNSGSNLCLSCHRL